MQIGGRKMKTLLILLLALVTAFVSAAPIRRPYRKPLKPARVVETTHPVSWKTVAAGGAAAGTVIAAYQVSDGVQEGMKSAAEKAPVAFLSSVTLSSIIMPVVLVIGIPLAGFFILTQLSH